jgi:hypothetical protein
MEIEKRKDSIFFRRMDLGYFTLFFLIVSTYFLLYRTLFWPLGVTNGWYWDSEFGDLSRNLKMMSCSLEYGYKIYTIELPGECGGYTYGFFLALIIDFLGITDAISSTLGVTFFLALVLTMLGISKVLRTKWQMSLPFTYLVFVSPGFWLAIVHGSMDIPIFAILFSVLMIAKKDSLWLPFLLILSTVLMKFFTLPLLFLLTIRHFLQNPSRRQGILLSILSVAAAYSTVQTVLQINYEDSDYRMAQGIFHTFGIESIPLWIEVISTKYGLFYFSLSTLERKFLGLLLFITITYLFSVKNPFKGNLLKPNSNVNHFELQTDPLAIKALIYFGVPYLALYAQGQNYDNKLIFLSLPCFTLYQLMQGSRQKQAFFIITVLTFWFTCFYPANFPRSIFVSIEIMGDLCVLVVSSLLLLAIWTYRTKILFGEK